MSFNKLRSLVIPIVTFVLSAAPAVAQTPRLIPPNVDPTVWGRPKEPYIATLQVTFTPASAVGTEQKPVVHQEKIYRDDAGRVRIDQIGRRTATTLRDPGKDSTVIIYPDEKRVVRLPTSNANIPAVWTVESLPPRSIAGIDAQGERYIRSVQGKDGQLVTIVEESWMSPQLGIVLERHVNNPLTGTTTELVTAVHQTVPDPSLFEIPQGYSIQEVPTAKP